MKKNHRYYTSDKAANNLRDALHREDEGDAAVYDDIEAANESVDNDRLESEQAENISPEAVEDKGNNGDEVEQLREQLEKEKKEYLFLMADFDNFRKRVVKEKAELIKNASEKVLKGLLPIVDDFERGLEATKGASDASSVREGMELIYNKLVRYLGENGVKPMDTANADFDADVHEAIATVPTGDATKKGKIIDTTQKGYMLNDKVLRHAKVVVGE